MRHEKYDYIKTVIEAGMPVLLVGEAGTGKSTIATQIAEDMNLTFYSISCTKQMSVNALLGFININGVYLPTQFRKAFEEGGVFLLDEIDAADPNALLTLNTIENGFVSFPDGIINVHKNFRLIATANPFNAHSVYTGRSKLDFSTIDRFFTVELERDSKLELSLTSKDIVKNVGIAREILSSHGITSTVTMRDTIRLHKLSKLNISECIYSDIIFNRHPDLYNNFKTVLEQEEAKAKKATMTQDEATTVDELYDILVNEANKNKDVISREDARILVYRYGRGPIIIDDPEMDKYMMEKILIRNVDKITYSLYMSMEYRFFIKETHELLYTFTEGEIEGYIPF